MEAHRQQEAAPEQPACVAWGGSIRGREGHAASPKVWAGASIDVPCGLVLSSLDEPLKRRCGAWDNWTAGGGLACLAGHIGP